MENKITKLFLNPNEMAFRKYFWPALENETITKVFRPGSRLAEDERGYREGQIVVVRVIDSIGADWAGVPPEFFKDLSKTVRIEKTQVKKINDLNEIDFCGSSFDVKSKESLKTHLGLIYNLFPSELSEDSIVTIISFSYINMENHPIASRKTIEELATKEDIVLAKKPVGNALNFSFEKSHTITFVEDDYPAKTPIMWNAVYDAFALPHSQAMFVAETKHITEILDALRRDEYYKGGGLGVGFKDEAVAYLDDVDQMARKIGAVNVVVKNTKGELVGYNTDGIGYAESLAEFFMQRGEHLLGKKVVLIGSGGTANSIAFALALRRMKVVILNRTIEKAQALSKRINVHFGFAENEAVRFGGETEILKEVVDADVVLNVSTKGASGVLEKYLPLASALLPATDENIAINHMQALKIFEKIPPNALISDVILGKGDTPFIAAAKEKKLDTLNGIPMVINQGVEAMWLVHSDEMEARGISKIDLYNEMKNAAGF
ncbi:MAG: hypothetical protein PHP62_03745 [Candidatus Moranbacteria bacterium]|nr:hypothetical protein [Candidatus Moranbacteria bacterium]